MTRSLLLLALLLSASAAAAQTFRPAGGPWTRYHELVGSAPDGRIFARVGQRLGVTTDGGATWTLVSETAAPSRVVADGDALIGIFSPGVRRSVDGGATWTPFGLDGLYVRDLATDGALYAVTTTEAYRRLPGGDWEPMQVPMTPPGSVSYRYVSSAGGTLAIAGSRLYCNYAAYGELIRSRDGGQTWTRSSGGPSPSGLAVGPDGTAWMTASDSQDCLGNPSSGAFHRQGPAEAALVRIGTGNFGGVAIGASGEAVVSPGPPDGNAPYGFGPIESAGNTILASSRGFGECGMDPPCFGIEGAGLYTSRGAHSAPTGFVPSAVRALALVRGVISVAADGAVFESVDGEWRVTTPLGGVTAFTPVPWEPDRVAAVTSLQPYLIPSAMWAGEPFARPDPMALGGVPAGGAVTVDGAVLTAGQEFYRPSMVVRYTETNQNGTGVLDACKVERLSVVGPHTVYAGAVGDPLACEAGSPRVYRSTDAGQTWVASDDGLAGLSVFAFAPTMLGAIPQALAGTSAGVFSQTGTNTWQPDGLQSLHVYALYAAPDGLLAGTDDGLWHRDGPGTWSRYGAGLDGRTVYAVLATSDAFGPWIGVGTDAGLYQTRAFGVSGENAPVAATALSAETSPNPARGLRTVRIAGATGAEARVTVVDLLGRSVADLGAVALRDGRGEATWDASGLPAGMYVVRASDAAGTVSARALVVR